ncbi:UNVERIFIED_CONTAM: DNA replication complex GINS protein SLD5 [Sesamum radiatum]|uniref:DNA replication complex GINS protein SLD5 n=1 Tax=Sesamum radiatum TaxID=300843 RepID=A0AAW2PZS9_SESRA
MDLGARESSAADDYESLMSTTDAELLKSAWRNEKVAPEILKFNADLVQRSRQQIQLMEEMVDEFNKNGVDPLTVSLYQMDLDRTMFLLRSYLRTRLQKIEKYVFHIQKTLELWNRLSKQEQKFARSFRATAGRLCHLQKQEIFRSLPADDGGEEPVNIEADDLYALPYKSIKLLVETGQIDLV